MGTAVIIGAGAGLSASIARKLADRGLTLLLASRNPSDLAELAEEISAKTVSCNARNPADIEALFEEADRLDEPLEVAVYNPSARVRGPVTDLDTEAVENAILVTAYGAFLMAQQAARRMLEHQPKDNGARGTMLFTGASAGVKGFANSSSFAMGKFALRDCASLSPANFIPRASISGILLSTAVLRIPIARAGKLKAIICSTPMR